MTYHWLGPWADDEKHYAGVPADLPLRIPADTYVNDLTDPQADE